MLMLVKDINIKSLVSGDKSARITLETLRPEDIPSLALLCDKMEIEVLFLPDIDKPMTHVCGTAIVCDICHPNPLPIIDKQTKKI